MTSLPRPTPEPEPLSDGLFAVQAALQQPRYRASEIPATSSTGLYALYLIHPEALTGVKVDPLDPLYLGMTESSLEVRNHFQHVDSSFSSPRRSLGAILREKLELRAIPRGTGKTPKDMTNYRFLPPGEERLTEWMAEHLVYCFAVVKDDVPDAEKILIARLKPPLNLNGWRNPLRKQLMALRSQCRDQARKYSPQGVNSP